MNKLFRITRDLHLSDRTLKSTIQSSCSTLNSPRSPSLHVPTTNQVVPSPPGTINNYDMGWRLALQAICPATDSYSATKLALF
ncbi:hypothetical protein TNCV_1884551 [Trichonephila clavipes]|nr:hypothetical protein TNCV_1884551 [Trichonephila clavipes]